MSPKVRIVLADHHPLVRAGIRTTLSSEADFLVAGEANDPTEIFHLCASHRPHVLILDLGIPGLSPTKFVRTFAQQHPDIKILILTTPEQTSEIRSLIASGVTGYMVKNEAPTAMVQAIRTILQGATWFSHAIIARLFQLEPFSIPATTPNLNLTKRESQILDAIAQGWNNAQLAAEFNLAEQTVRNYTSRIYSKLEVSSRSEAIVWAREHGFGITLQRNGATRGKSSANPPIRISEYAKSAIPHMQPTGS